jgi:type VI secretion system protein ImpJ
MFLQPQHFQQEERYLLNTISTRIAAYQPYYFGLTEILVDRDALANDLVTVVRCSGVLPDGTNFSIPREDGQPVSRSFSDHFSHEQQFLDFYLALPLIGEGRGNVIGAGGEGNLPCRFKSKTIPVTDEVFGAQRKEIEIGGANFVILFGDESLDSFSTVQIGRLKRTPNGQVELDTSYIPALLQIGTSTQLMNYLRSLLELLLAKCSSLGQGRKQVEGGFAEFSGGEETAFRLLGTISTFTPLLNNYLYTPTIHPYELFTTLTMLSGGLSTFSADVSVKNFPRYEHLNPMLTFGSLIKIIRRILEADISAGCINLPISQVNQATYAADVPDAKLFSSAKFFFGVSAKVPEKELIIGVLQRIKMCSRDRVDLLISSAMPGLQLMHTSHPPEGLSTKPGFLYFSLDQQSQFWKLIQSSSSIAFYFPNNFPELKMEMLALKE